MRVTNCMRVSVGPLRFDAEGYRGGFPTLLYRPETSTKTSNIIFVDSPVGTGFSYATTEEGLKSSDTKAVKQLVVFLRKVGACAFSPVSEQAKTPQASANRPGGLMLLAIHRSRHHSATDCKIFFCVNGKTAQCFLSPRLV